MDSTSPYTEKLAAADKQAGFDYQFYIFLTKCVEIEVGQTIGYEEKDDVHIELNSKNTFIQIKHTIQSTTDGSRPNLTQKDSDLWKTLFNWINNINDEHNGRRELDEQLDFIGRSEFVLFSNKAYSENNKFLSLIAKFKVDEISLADLKKGVQGFIGEKEEKDYNEIDNYIVLFLSQPSQWMEAFLKSISFMLDQDDIIEIVVEKIRDRFLIKSEEQCMDVYQCLFTNFKSKIYNEVAAGRRSVAFDYETIKSFISNCVYPHVNKPIVRKHLTFDLPDNLEEQSFIRQLIDIGDIQPTDRESIIEYTKFKLLMAQNLREWEQCNELLPSMKQEFIDDCIVKWRNLHKKSHRTSFNAGVGEDKLKAAALNCLDEVRQIELRICDVPLDSALSNGQFYCLNDEIQIGWCHDWETRYLKS